MRHVVSGGWVLAGVVLLSSAGLRWVETGPGSRFSGLELADNIRSGVLSPSWGVWVAAALYAFVGAGGVFIATATSDHLAVVLSRGMIALVASSVFAFTARSAIPLSEWAAGSTLAALAFVIASVLTVVQLTIRFGNRT